MNNKDETYFWLGGVCILMVVYLIKSSRQNNGIKFWSFKMWSFLLSTVLLQSSLYHIVFGEGSVKDYYHFKTTKDVWLFFANTYEIAVVLQVVFTWYVFHRAPPPSGDSQPFFLLAYLILGVIAFITCDGKEQAGFSSDTFFLRIFDIGGIFLACFWFWKTDH